MTVTMSHFDLKIGYNCLPPPRRDGCGRARPRSEACIRVTDFVIQWDLLFISELIEYDFFYKCLYPTVWLIIIIIFFIKNDLNMLLSVVVIELYVRTQHSGRSWQLRKSSASAFITAKEREFSSLVYSKCLYRFSRMQYACLLETILYNQSPFK